LPGVNDPVKSTKLITGFSIALLTALSAQTQGTFQNLNFESADVSGFSPGNIPTVGGIPGWTAYIGGTPQGNNRFSKLSLNGRESQLASALPVLVGRSWPD
jgi:hypothetical protein